MDRIPVTFATHWCSFMPGQSGTLPLNVAETLEAAGIIEAIGKTEAADPGPRRPLKDRAAKHYETK